MAHELIPTLVSWPKDQQHHGGSDHLILQLPVLWQIKHLPPGKTLDEGSDRDGPGLAWISSHPAPHSAAFSAGDADVIKYNLAAVKAQLTKLLGRDYLLFIES
ncbi:hypothetical protein AAES_137415 [Amazona aestiva]|uniref:Uncharacterized protein n=1 Tax=Amazona aestiva TaxID=12930 RepID=A0A0Q3QYQ5_AMAAE|nr:hypothetical protein AAES_137415 [Amazona aestiva]